MSDQEPTNATEQQPDPLEEEGEYEDLETEAASGQEVEPSAEALAAPEGQQTGAATTAPVAATPGTAANAQTVTWKEDPNDFDESPIEIAITLHPLKGHPAEERLVTICVHNHSGPPVTNYYTQGELTEQSPLDRLLAKGIAPEIRKFRAELSRRKQEQFEREQQAKRSRHKPTSTTAGVPAPAATPVPAPTQAAPGVHVGPLAEEASTTSTSPAPPVPATPAKAAKKEEGLVQQPLF